MVKKNLRPDPNAAGQSGDDQGLRRRPDDDSESVAELLDEGQAYEAEAISGAERAEGEEGGEVKSHEVPVDDVPPEYLDRDQG